METQILTVTELNSYIKLLLDNTPLLSRVCVRGEISNYKAYPNASYFSLKDSAGAIKCVMFKSDSMKLRFRPENGMQVLATGRVSAYPRDGVYQLYCSSMMPEGSGDLQMAFEQLKAKLQSEGLFDPAHKKPIPAFPKTIAVITSDSGAAVHDIIRILGQRWKAAEVKLLPVRVQGATAGAEIAGAIRYANRYHVADVIIVGRGGGSMEDLWCFNEEVVARAIYDSEIPVISAVGHEPDVTISDYVADRRAATPTNGAEIAVPDADEISDRIESLRNRLCNAQQVQLSRKKQRLSALSAKAVVTDPLTDINNRKMRVDRLNAELDHLMDRMLSEKKMSLRSVAASVDAMSPLKVLSRGYSITENKAGHPVMSVSEVNTGDNVNIRMQDGSLSCSVNEIVKEIEDK